MIHYQLPVNSEVRLEVFDMLGRREALLADGIMEAGTHEVTFDASNVASGVYLYRLHVHRSLGAGGRANQEERVRIMTLIK